MPEPARQAKHHNTALKVVSLARTPPAQGDLAPPDKLEQAIRRLALGHIPR